MRILLVEDNSNDAQLVCYALCPAMAPAIDISHAHSLGEALALLPNGSHNVAILDLHLGDSSGLETLHQIRAAAPALPIVVLTGLGDETVALQALQEGAQDYLVKGEYDARLLTRALRYAIERQRILTELEQAREQKLRLKDEFLSHVSHELRSPLTAIDLFLNNLLQGLAGPITHQQREHLEIALRNTHQLQSMIDDLLEVTRSETDKLTIEPCRLSLPGLLVEVQDSLRTSGEARGIQLSAALPAGLPAVFADPARVRQILVNLIENTFKFTPAGGSVHVRPDFTPQHPDVLRISVSDTGCGIAPEHLSHLFDRLYQVPQPGQGGRRGLGLGLYLCKELVSRMGGEISVESQPGRGSTFHFTLPVFSVEDLIAPLFHQLSRLPTAVTLVFIEIVPPDSSPAFGRPARQHRSVRELVARCTLPDLDVLLPSLSTHDARECLIAVAFAEPAGARVLAHRIEGQLARSDALASSGWHATVSCLPLEFPPRSHDRPALLRWLAERIDSQIQHLTYSGGFAHV